MFAALVDPIRQQSHSWASHFLSPAGKQVILQSILTAVLAYTMSCFKLPAFLCKKIQSILTCFWWDDKPDTWKNVVGHLVFAYAPKGWRRPWFQRYWVVQWLSLSKDKQAHPPLFTISLCMHSIRKVLTGFLLYGVCFTDNVLAWLEMFQDTYHRCFVGISIAVEALAFRMSIPLQFLQVTLTSRCTWIYKS